MFKILQFLRLARPSAFLQYIFFLFLCGLEPLHFCDQFAFGARARKANPALVIHQLLRIKFCALFVCLNGLY